MPNSLDPQPFRARGYCLLRQSKQKLTLLMVPKDADCVPVRSADSARVHCNPNPQAPRTRPRDAVPSLYGLTDSATILSNRLDKKPSLCKVDFIYKCLRTNRETENGVDTRQTQESTDGGQEGK